MKAISVDGSSKMAVVDEQMDARDVCIILAEKNHQNFGPNWTLVERLEDLELGEKRSLIFVDMYVCTCGLWMHVYGRCFLAWGLVSVGS